ncbi:MAG: DUF1286 domain-containing protein [Conexivisphaerales archaeon]
MEDKLHASLATGMLTLLNSTFIGMPDALFLEAITAIMANVLIDGFGTEKIDENNYYTTPETHTVPHAMLLGVVTGLVSAILINMLTGLAFLSIMPLALMGGVIAALLHLALDVLTGDAIYIKHNGKWQKITLVKEKIQSVRGAIILISLFMLLVAFKIYSI